MAEKKNGLFPYNLQQYYFFAGKSHSSGLRNYVYDRLLQKCS